jgi:hypothetical protein
MFPSCYYFGPFSEKVNRKYGAIWDQLKAELELQEGGGWVVYWHACVDTLAGGWFA